MGSSYFYLEFLDGVDYPPQRQRLPESSRLCSGVHLGARCPVAHPVRRDQSRATSFYRTPLVMAAHPRSVSVVIQLERPSS